MHLIKFVILEWFQLAPVPGEPVATAQDDCSAVEALFLGICLHLFSQSVEVLYFCQINPTPY